MNLIDRKLTSDKKSVSKLAVCKDVVFTAQYDVMTSHRASISGMSNISCEYMVHKPLFQNKQSISHPHQQYYTDSPHLSLSPSLTHSPGPGFKHKLVSDLVEIVTMVTQHGYSTTTQIIQCPQHDVILHNDVTTHIRQPQRLNRCLLSIHWYWSPDPLIRS